MVRPAQVGFRYLRWTNCGSFWRWRATYRLTMRGPGLIQGKARRNHFRQDRQVLAVGGDGHQVLVADSPYRTPAANMGPQ